MKKDNTQKGHDIIEDSSSQNTVGLGADERTKDDSNFDQQNWVDTDACPNKSPKTPESPKSPKTPMAIESRQNTRGFIGDIGDLGETGDNDRTALPSFSGRVHNILPVLLQKIANEGKTPNETDALLLGSITVISSCLPGIQGRYDGVTVYPNLFFFLTARAASGKGRLELCRFLVLPIHRRLKEQRDQAMIKYETDLAKWEKKGSNKRGTKPRKPAQTMLIIPANTSSTAVYQLLNDNGGKGLIFETEGDTLANDFEND